MKPNEAPEKIYISPNSEESTYYVSNQYNRLIEYIRKDAFIEKALKFLDENFFFDSKRYSIESGVFDSKEEMIEDFKKYIEGE